MSKTFHRPQVAPDMPDWLAARIVRAKRRLRARARRQRRKAIERQALVWRP